MSQRAKWSVGVVVILLIVAVIGLGAAKNGSKATDVRIESVQRRDLVATVTASGQIEPQTKVDVASDISGRIIRLAVKEGQMVKKGQFLLQIDPSTYQAGVERADAALASSKASLAQAKANLEQAQRNYRRSADIKKANPALVSDESLEQLRTTVDVDQALYNAASHGVDQAQAALRDAQSQLDKTTIVAPMSGRITRLAVEQGETAVPGTFNKDAATLLTISDMGVLETTVKVDETDVARIAVGDSASIEIDAFPDTTFVGKVVDIANSSVQNPAASAGATDQAVDYEVKVQLLNPPPDTRPDFSATAKIVTATRKQALSIPIIALTVRDRPTPGANADTAQIVLGKKPAVPKDAPEEEGVFVVGADNHVTFHPVKIGIAGADYFEVLSGLKEGQRIVAGSYQAIRGLKDSSLVREVQSDTTSKDIKT
jgi:HlyD family secretion protein